MSRMSLPELESALWGAAQLLRGKINATGYKEYVFPLVFFKRISDVPYVVTVDSIPAHETANKEKFFPPEWINPQQNDVNEQAIRYFLPLIQGEVNIAMRNGMPLHFKLQSSRSGKY